MNSDQQVDLDYYCWREQVGDRLLIPHSDPMVYEYPVDLMFSSPEEAIDYREENYEDETDWILVHYKGEIVESS